MACKLQFHYNGFIYKCKPFLSIIDLVRIFQHKMDQAVKIPICNHSYLIYQAIDLIHILESIDFLSFRIQNHINKYYHLLHEHCLGILGN